jgi:hypothetical protein
MALAVSVRDLRESKHPGIATPSIEWLRLQLCPQNEFKKSALLHTGRLGIKFMVQSRQLNFEHADSHYAAATLKYLREFSIMFREHAI